MTEKRKTVPEVLPLVREYVQHVGPGCGYLHIVLSDGNVDDGSIDFCISEAATNGDAIAATVGMELRGLSKTQRRKIVSLLW